MSDWEEDWDNSDDAVYDGPDEEQLAAAAKRKAMLEYMDWSLEVEDAIIKSIGQAEYYASEHWINNPLIKPQSKVHLFEQWEERIRKEQNERLIKLLDADRNESHAIDDIFDGIVFQTISRAEFKQALIELIKGETK